jgi:sulfonate dioxygenase
MAPSAVDISTLTKQPPANSILNLTGEIGPYKELAPIGYEKDVEEKGKHGLNPAQVRNFLLPSKSKTK